MANDFFVSTGLLLFVFLSIFFVLWFLGALKFLFDDERGE